MTLQKKTVCCHSLPIQGTPSFRAIQSLVAAVALGLAALGAQAGETTNALPSVNFPPAQPVIISFPPTAAAAAAATTPETTESVCDATLAWFDRAMPLIPQLAPVAEAATRRILSDGRLFIAGNAGFCDEMFFRAGGFPFARIWKGEELGPNDVMIVGELRPNEESNRYLQPEVVARGSGPAVNGMLIYIAAHQWPQVNRCLPIINAGYWKGNLYMLDSGGLEGAAIADLAVSQLGAVAMAWALQGEIMSAATRQGKTLATYSSDFEPGSALWDAGVRALIYHPDYNLAPIPAGTLARKYLETCRADIEAFRKSQVSAVRLAARRMAEAMRDGAMVWIVSDGHLHVQGSIIPPGLTRLKNAGRGYKWEYYSRKMPATDMLLYIGYLRYPEKWVGVARQRGVQTVVLSVDDGPTDEQVTHILGCWKDFDSCVDLKGYPIRVLPASGVVQTAQWYSLMAEMAAAPAAEEAVDKKSGPEK